MGLLDGYEYSSSCFLLLVFFFFFFQAEDGIRDHCVTGVQTCALPIYHGVARPQQGSERAHVRLVARREDERSLGPHPFGDLLLELEMQGDRPVQQARSEERRVGKEWRSRWSWREDKEK